jgi:hypothetical protein
MLMVLVSILLGVIPLLGIAWTIKNGTLTTVDGLFLSLILAALSAIFFLNAVLELRRGLKDETPAKSADKAQKASQGG